MLIGRVNGWSVWLVGVIGVIGWDKVSCRAQAFGCSLFLVIGISGIISVMICVVSSGVFVRWGKEIWRAEIVGCHSFLIVFGMLGVAGVVSIIVSSHAVKVGGQIELLLVALSVLSSIL